MKCPVCRVPTYAVEHLELELDLCPQCQGAWFDRGELDLLLDGEQATAQSAAVTDEAVRPCPLCDKPMNKVNIGPSQRVLIDSCPEGCGLWFDHHELDDLTTDLRAAGWGLQLRVREFLNEMFPDRE